MMLFIIILAACIWLLARLLRKVFKALLYTAGQMQALYEDDMEWGV